MFLVFGYLILLSYPYFFSKIDRFHSLGPLSLVEEKRIDIKQTFSHNRRTDQLDNHLLKGEKVIAKFKVSENNFGLLLFRFAKLSAKTSDVVAFRIKKEGEDKWYYENNYKADQFQPDEYFTFGFPPIKNSKNNTYVFEIESLSGTYKNGIGVSLREPQVAIVYKYTREDLANFNTLSPFIFKKFVYVARNVDFLGNWQLLAAFVLSLIFVILLIKKKISISDIVRFLPTNRKRRTNFLKLMGKVINKKKSSYLSFEKEIVKYLKKTSRWFTSTKFYLQFLNTDTKKRLTIGLLIFFFAFIYRFSATSVDQLGVNSFYAGLGGQGDYDQFIRAATCAVRNFCPAILGQNFLIESSILGIFYKLFGFTEALKAYLYLMIILSSIVATLPYLLLSRKTWISMGGIIGSLFLATSDFLTHMALNLPPDNGSLFTFSMFFIVYFLTLNIGTIRWLLFFGLMGIIDGLNKLLLLINDLAVFILFVPVFFYERARKEGLTAGKQFQSLFKKKNIRILLLSLIPLLVFLIIYVAWEYVVQIKFSAPYFLRLLVETHGSDYISPTSFNESLARGNILGKLYYYAGSTVVMEKRIIAYGGLNAMFLAPIFIGLLFFTFRKPKFSIAKLISIVIFSAIAYAILELFKNNYLGIQEIGQYVYAWSNDIYVNVFLFLSIIFLFILNFKYQAFKLALPIVPYVIILIILTKNSPWDRLWVHVVVWSIILLSFLVDSVLSDTNKNYALKRFWVGIFLLAFFILFYIMPKTSSMVAQLRSGIDYSRNEVKYLRWVNSELPENSIILAGGKSDLVTVAENIKRPIIYSTLWTGALLIRPKEIPGVKPSDFHVLSVYKINEIPGVKQSDFSIVSELKSKDNFKKKKYIILENDIYIWRGRVTGVADSVFSSSSPNLPHGEDYSIKVYKFNPILKKAIYELNLRDTSID